MEQENFTMSEARARRAWTRPRVCGLVTKDFQWNTGLWIWWPVRFHLQVPLWNPNGGPALQGTHTQRYWLCLGWSRIEVFEGAEPFEGVDPVDTIQNGGK